MLYSGAVLRTNFRVQHALKTDDMDTANLFNNYFANLCLDDNKISIASISNEL